MNWTKEAIAELLHEKPELLKIIETIKSFPKERQAEVIRIAVRILEGRKDLCKEI